ncbi:MAG TPA: glycosyltransferase [Caulobacteraceae bacterium]|nr:glycosyltransferase [Caulobacteraceae bacterium]
MRLLLIGKRSSITHWLEHAGEAFVAAGHEVRTAPFRNPALHPAIDAALTNPRLGALRARAIRALAQRFVPDLALAIGGYSVPMSILEALASAPSRPPLAAWVGDAFGPEAGPWAGAFDLVGYTDTGLLQRHRDLGFKAEAVFLPHAANAGRREPRLGGTRRPLSFVAVPTPHRRALVGALERPIALYGPGWTPFPSVRHEIHARKLSARAVRAVYGGSRAVLNIRNEANVVHGLNQRSFEPYLAGAAVLSDDQPDLPLLFEPGAEALVFAGPEEMNAHHARLIAEPEYAAKIAAAGERRVVADHTYEKRLETITGRLWGARRMP